MCANVRKNSARVRKKAGSILSRRKKESEIERLAAVLREIFTNSLTPRETFVESSRFREIRAIFPSWLLCVEQKSPERVRQRARAPKNS